MTKLFFDANKFPYYNELPSGWRIAVYEDFIDSKSAPLTGKPFLIASYKYPGRFWGYRVTDNWPYYDSDFLDFLEQDHVYVQQK